jgi:hypothetical protein
MAVSQFLDFLKSATGYVKPEAADLEEAGGIESPAARYHTRVVIAAAVCGVIVSIAGTVGAVMEKGSKNDLKMLLLAPLIFGIAGILLGVAGTCLMAPNEFLTGPVGRKWMALIGTKSVLVARIACGILVVIVLGATIALAVKAALGK